MSVQLTKQLATQLGEVAPVPLAQIRRSIDLAGAETAQALVDEAVTSAAGEGMLNPRRETAHGGRHLFPPRAAAAAPGDRAGGLD